MTLGGMQDRAGTGARTGPGSAGAAARVIKGAVETGSGSEHQAKSARRACSFSGLCESFALDGHS